jgi:hypothetical protein
VAQLGAVVCVRRAGHCVHAVMFTLPVRRGCGCAERHASAWDESSLAALECATRMSCVWRADSHVIDVRVSLSWVGVVASCACLRARVRDAAEERVASGVIL